MEKKSKKGMAAIAVLIVVLILQVILMMHSVRSMQGNGLLEVGKDFTFIDEEFKVQVGGEAYRINLLFYHRGLQCLVAFELKIGKFKPE